MQSKIYRCFVASPSDTNQERDYCEEVFESINLTIGNQFNFRIEVLRWEKNVIPGFGIDGQSVINDQIGDKYDIFVGLMNTRFGHPTGRAGSGTEEEFNIAYTRFKNEQDIQILFYFNQKAPAQLTDIDPEQLGKVNAFKKKIAELGGLYYQYNGPQDFKTQFLKHITTHLLKIHNTDEEELKKKEIKEIKKDILSELFSKKFTNAMKVFSGQPRIWVDPVLRRSNEISENADENFDKRIDIKSIVENPSSTIIKAPPQFGLTCLAHYFVKTAWESGHLWIYLDADNLKAHNIHNSVKNEVANLGLGVDDVKCIVLDSWNLWDSSNLKKLKNLCDAYKEIPIIVMQTIDDSKFKEQHERESIQRAFEVLHLLALPRVQIRHVVSEYNKAKVIAEEDVLLNKVISDMEVLNIHRTPFNCLTLLKVSEKYFDESPVNRTQMIEMVLFILFNVDEIPHYKSRPDLKDCEYVLGIFCEYLIRAKVYAFSRQIFLEKLNEFCKQKLIDLEVEVVFDILLANNIIIQRDSNFAFRSSYWIFYFAAKRMHINKEFADYVFETKCYLLFPEIIEFYTGIDRNRPDALKILLDDIKVTCDVVNNKVGLPDSLNPYKNIQWQPDEEQITRIKDEIGDAVLNSGLPEIVKDQFADKRYNQIKPYNQSIGSIIEEYSLVILMQKIKATSRALRNSDYVDPDLKRTVLKEILRAWIQLAKVIFALTPMLAERGKASFEGIPFILADDFGDTFEKRVNKIIQVNSINVVYMFKDDLYSTKLGPLLFDLFNSELNPLTKHQLALLITLERPRNWKTVIQNYIVELSKNSFFLFSLIRHLRTRYQFDFATPDVLKDIEFLIKMGLAKHEFGDKNPGLNKIIKIPNKILPKRDENF